MRSNFAMPDLIRVRVFSDEKRHMKEAARRQGMSLSEFVRQSANQFSRERGGSPNA